MLGQHLLQEKGSKAKVVTPHATGYMHPTIAHANPNLPPTTRNQNILECTSQDH